MKRAAQSPARRRGIDVVALLFLVFGSAFVPVRAQDAGPQPTPIGPVTPERFEGDLRTLPTAPPPEAGAPIEEVPEGGCPPACGAPAAAGDVARAGFVMRLLARLFALLLRFVIVAVPA